MLSFFNIKFSIYKIEPQDNLYECMQYECTFIYVQSYIMDQCPIATYVFNGLYYRSKMNHQNQDALYIVLMSQDKETVHNFP